MRGKGKIAKAIPKLLLPTYSILSQLYLRLLLAQVRIWLPKICTNPQPVAPTTSSGNAHSSLFLLIYMLPLITDASEINPNSHLASFGPPVGPRTLNLMIVLHMARQASFPIDLKQPHHVVLTTLSSTGSTLRPSSSPESVCVGHKSN